MDHDGYYRYIITTTTTTTDRGHHGSDSTTDGVLDTFSCASNAKPMTARNLNPLQEQTNGIDTFGGRGRGLSVLPLAASTRLLPQ